jgi:hypothetical protein
LQRAFVTKQHTNENKGHSGAEKRYSYLVPAAAAGTSLPVAILSALPNSDVVDEAQLANRTKHTMRVSKLSAYRSVERCWATNQKGRDVSVVERGWAGDSKGWDGWWVGHASNFTAQNINASDHPVASLTQQLKQMQAMYLVVWMVEEVDSERLNNTRTVTEDPCGPRWTLQRTVVTKQTN